MQDEFVFENNEELNENDGAVQEKKPFEKPKEGIIFIVDCHCYDNKPFDEEIKQAVMKTIKQTPIFYPKDRFALLFFGNEEKTSSLPEGIKMAHVLEMATKNLLEQYKTIFDSIKPSNKIIPLINAFEAAHTIFEKASIINQPRIVFIVPPEFFEHHQITPQINAYVATNPPEPLFFSIKYQIENFPFKCFSLNRLERVCIAFHKSVGYYYDFIPFEGVRAKVIINNITTNITASTLGNEVVDKNDWKIVVGKRRKEEMPEGEKRELTTHAEGEVWDYSYKSDKVTFTEVEYNKLHRVDEKYKNSIVVKGKISRDFVNQTTKNASFIRPVNDDGWYGALYQTLLSSNKALRCDFFTLTTVREVAIVPIDSNVEFVPSGLYIIYIPYADDVFSRPKSMQTEFDIKKTICLEEQNQSMRGLIDSYTKENVDLLALKNPIVEERINRIIEAMKLDLEEKIVEKEPEITGDIGNVRSRFIMTEKRIKQSATASIELKLSDDQIYEIYGKIEQGQTAGLTVPVLKAFLVQSNVNITSKDKKPDLIEKAKHLVEKINEQIKQEELGEVKKEIDN